MRRTCSHPGCEKPHHGRSLCRSHYEAARRSDPASLPPRQIFPVTEDAFWLRVDRSAGPEGCWPWTGGIDRDGYGNCTTPWRKGSGGAHCVAHFYATGQVADSSSQLDHTCHPGDGSCPAATCPHRACVNPAHLEVVTPHENTHRGDTPASRLAARPTCDKGHPFTGANLAIRRDGSRKCRACHAEYMREWNRQRKAS